MALSPRFARCPFEPKGTDPCAPLRPGISLGFSLALTPGSGRCVTGQPAYEMTGAIPYDFERHRRHAGITARVKVREGGPHVTQGLCHGERCSSIGHRPFTGLGNQVINRDAVDLELAVYLR